MELHSQPRKSPEIVDVCYYRTIYARRTAFAFWGSATSTQRLDRLASLHAEALGQICATLASLSEKDNKNFYYSHVKMVNFINLSRVKVNGSAVLLPLAR
jgi:hypothetical protein